MDLTTDPVQTRLVEAVDTALTRTGGVPQELAAIGVPELSIPQQFGGLGLGLSADIVVNQRLGYGLVPLAAYRETVFAIDLVAGANAELPTDLLTEMLKGNMHATTVGMHGPTNLRVDDNKALWGEGELVADANYNLVVARAIGADGEVGYYMVRPESPTCTTQPTERLSIPAVRLCFNGSRATKLTLAENDHQQALDSARVRQSAVLLGIAERAHDAARSFVNRRVQYGAQLIELQTVAHRLARLAGDADGWELLVHEAAWHRDCGFAITSEAARLLAVITDHVQSAVRTALQLHGARGMVAHSTAAAAYRIASVEGSRMGTPSRLLPNAGLLTLAERDAGV